MTPCALLGRRNRLRLLIAITLMLPFVILLLGLPIAGVVKLLSAAFAVAVGQGSY